MLTKKTLAIAEALAVSTDLDIAANASPVVVALTDSLEGALPLTPEDYAARVPELSATSPEYAVISDEVTTALAENLRGTFEQIRIYGRGLSGQVASALMATDLDMSDTNRMAKNFLLGQMDLEFIRTDHPFYSSLFYPLTAPKLVADYANISLDSLEKVQFARWDSSQVAGWLNIDNPEINELMMSSNVDLSEALSSLARVWGLPFHFDEEGKSVDFTRPRLDRAETLFIQYVILCKMVAEDAPFEGLTVGGLEDYRQHVRFLHCAYQKALIELKTAAVSLLSFPIRIVERTEVAVRDASPVEGAKVFKRVRVKATVYYNTTGLDMCLDKGMSFSDVALAYFYRKYVNLDPSIASSYPSNLEGALVYLHSLCESVVHIAHGASAQVYNRVIMQEVVKFICGCPELSERFSSTNNVDEIQRAVTGFLGNRNVGSSLAHNLDNRKLSVEDAVFATGLPVDFLGFIGCKDAQAVLGMTIDLGNAGDCEVTKRENLHVAVIQHFVNKLFTVK